MKNRRHIMIHNIIEKMNIGTQEELAQELRARGVPVTQATVSRDIGELRLIKISDENGKHRYVSAKQPKQPLNDRQIRIFVDSVLSVAASENLIVIKTSSGSAPGAAETVDALDWPEIMGTIAGDNTILIVLTSADMAKKAVQKFEDLLK